MSRRVVLWVGIVALVLVCAAILLLIRLDRQAAPSPSPTPSPTATPSDTQQTMFFGVRSDNGAIADAVTLAARTTGTAIAGSWLSMQPGLAVTVDADGQVTLAASGPQEPEQTGQTVGNQLGVSIDDVMVLDRLAFAALVDSVDGVTVDVKRPVIIVLPDGRAKVIVRRGTRTLYGPAAAEYVITLQPGEVQADRMARFDDVLRQVIIKLPPTGDRTRDILAGLGSSSRTSGSLDQMADTMLAMRTALLDDVSTYAPVPASKSTSAGQTIYTILVDPNWDLMQRMFEPSLLVPGRNGQGIRSRVYAAGVPASAAATAGDALAQIDQSLVWGGVIAGQRRSQIFAAEEKYRPNAVAAAAALGLPASVVAVNAQEAVGVQVAVRLAADSSIVGPAVSASPSSN